MTDRRVPRRGLADLRSLGKSAVGAVLERVGRGSAKVQERRPLPYDLLEDDDSYLVVFDAPGATSSDVTVRFLDGEVQVRLDRFREYHEGYEMRFPGRGLSLDGQVELPRDAVVDPGEATATLADNGSLQIRVPKSGDSRQIPVEEEADAAVGTGAEDGDADDPTATGATDGEEDADGNSLDR